MHISDIIEHAVDWRRDMGQSPFTAILPGDVSLFVDPALFSQIDTRLLPVMEQIVSAPFLRAHSARWTLQMWANPQPFLLKFRYNTDRYPIAILSLSGQNPAGKIELVIRSDMIDTLANGTQFTCGLPGNETVEIDPHVLEAEYPGCLERMRYLQTLGLDDDELAREVFSVVQMADDIVLPLLDSDPAPHVIGL